MADVENPINDHEKVGCCKDPTPRPGVPYKKPILIEFRDFVLGGNLIRIAVAFVLALALEKMVTTFVRAFVSPVLGIIGQDDIETLSFVVRNSVFRYGLFLDSVISFLVICIVLFFALILPVQRYGGRCVPAWVVRKCPYCFQDMAAIGSKCPSCCSTVEPLNILPGKTA